MNKGKEIVIDSENGEEIYAKNSMKLEGVQAFMPAVISYAAFSYSKGHQTQHTICFLDLASSWHVWFLL